MAFGDVSAGFEQLERTASVVYGACAGIWVMTVFAEPTLRDMLGARPALQAMSRRHPKGFPALSWILPEAGYRMQTDAREAVADITREYKAAVLAQATLIEGAGFQVATVRGIVSGLDFMSRSSCPKKVFSDLPSAVVWCTSHAPRAAAVAPVQHVEAVIAEIRASVAPPV